jgi:hypothetical protein
MRNPICRPSYRNKREETSVEKEETFVRRRKEETFVEKGNEKIAKVGLCPSVEFWIL